MFLFYMCFDLLTESDSGSDTSDPKVRFILQFRPGVFKLLQTYASQVDSNDFGWSVMSVCVGLVLMLQESDMVDI